MQLKKLVGEDNPDFDRKENFENAINESIKMANGKSKEFSKFKSDYFQVTEQIVNKDITTLKVSILKQSHSKLLKINKNLEDTGESIKQASEIVTDVRERFQNFEQSLFKSKNNQIFQISQKCEHLLAQISDLNSKIAELINLCKGKIKSTTPFTKE